MQTYTITNDRLSPTADVVTEPELRDYVAAMRDDNGWDVDPNALVFGGSTVTLDSEVVAIANRVA